MVSQRSLSASTVANCARAEPLPMSAEAGSGLRALPALAKASETVRLLSPLETAGHTVGGKSTTEMGTAWIPAVLTLISVFGQRSWDTLGVGRLLEGELTVTAAQGIRNAARFPVHNASWARKLPWRDRSRTLRQVCTLSDLVVAVSLAYLAPGDST